jgi:hypothetical protein
MAGIDSALTVRGVLTRAPARRMLTATGQPRPHIVWWESEHESHPAAVDARHRPHQRDAVLCAVRFKLFAEFWVSVLRRSSVPGAGVRLVGLWGSTRPRNEPRASPAWASSGLICLRILWGLQLAGVQLRRRRSIGCPIRRDNPDRPDLCGRTITLPCGFAWAARRLRVRHILPRGGGGCLRVSGRAAEDSREQYGCDALHVGASV